MQDKNYIYLSFKWSLKTIAESLLLDFIPGVKIMQTHCITWYPTLNICHPPPLCYCNSGFLEIWKLNWIFPLNEWHQSKKKVIFSVFLSLGKSHLVAVNDIIFNYLIPWDTKKPRSLRFFFLLCISFYYLVKYVRKIIMDELYKDAAANKSNSAPYFISLMLKNWFMPLSPLD